VPPGAAFRSERVHHRSNCRCYPSSRSMTSPVSARAGGRFRLPAEFPAEPVARLLRLPFRRVCSSHAPVARVAAFASSDSSRRCRHLRAAPNAPLRSPSGCPSGSCSEDEPRSCVPVPLTPREPGWPALHQCDHCWPHRRRAPFLGFRLALRCPVRRSLCLSHRRRSSSLFLHTGLSPGKWHNPQKFLRRPLLAHSLCTARTSSRTSSRTSAGIADRREGRLATG
jgi:hypothetical protein